MARFADHLRITLNDGLYTMKVVDTSYIGTTDEHAQDTFRTWKTVPRGLCNISIYDQDGTLAANRMLFGLSKFTYDDQPKFLKELNCHTLHKKYFMTKENGECMHVSAFRFDSLEYWIIGSKNVHILFKKDDPFAMLSKYTHQQFTYATAMAQQFFSNTRIAFNQLFDYLAKNQYTFCIESCRTDSLHITLYTETKMFLYAITSPICQGITVCPPAQVPILAQQFGLDPIEYIDITVADLERMTQIEKDITDRHNSEGAVVYVTALNEAGQEITVWSYKYKADEYVFWRAIREIMKNTPNLSAGLSKIDKLPRTHNHISQIESRLHQGKQLITYWYQNLGADKSYCYNQFPYLIQQFRSLDQTAQQQLDHSIQQAPIQQQKTCILFKGVPCTGKTTIGLRLASLLNGAYIDQDMFHGDRNKFCRELTQLVKQAHNVVIVGKSHFNKKQRLDTVNCLTDEYKIYIIEMQFSGSSTQFEQVIKSRLVERGVNHSTLRPDHPDIDKLIKGFIRSMSKLDTDEQQKYTCIPVDIMQPVDEIVTQIIAQIQ